MGGQTGGEAMARPTSGAELVEGLEGSAGAKQKLRLFLQTLLGERSIGEVGEELGINEAMVHRLRSRALTAALQDLEPKAPGRPRKEAPSEELRALLSERDLLRRDLEIEKAKLAALELLGGVGWKKRGQTAGPIR